MRKLSVAILVVSILVGCTEPGQKTGMGAAAGGALGAGLGAIVGNQTGSAGRGLVVGSAVGAATGALVANAFEANEKKLNEQDEKIKRQEELARAQRNELEQLRQPNSHSRLNDSVASGRYPSGLSQGWDRQAGLGVKRAGPSEIASARARLRPGAFSGTPDLRSSSSAHFALPPKSQPAVSSVKEREITTAALPSSGYAGVADITEKSSSETASKTASASAESAPPKASSAVVAAALPSTGASSSEECTQARSEFEKTSQVTEASDKLFHLRRAVRMCPEDASLRSDAGKLYLSMNRGEDAKYEFQEALRIDPTLAAAKTALASLGGGAASSTGRY